MRYSVFLLDNFDSFTYNLVDQLRQLDCEVTIYRNDIQAEQLLQKMQNAPYEPVLVLSPGPGHPRHAGCMMELLNACCGHYPILGICLGHQAIVEHYGGKIGAAEVIVHGKSSNINHQHDPIFNGLSNPLKVARYHSLVATQIPETLNVIAYYQDMPMAVLHSNNRVLGFQFHPESVLTTQGSTLLAQSLHFITQEL